MAKERLIIEIPQSCKGKVAGTSNDIIFTAGMGPCCGVVIYNIKTGDCSLAHLDEGNIRSRPFQSMIEDVCPSKDYQNLRAYITEEPNKPRQPSLGPVYYNELVSAMHETTEYSKGFLETKLIKAENKSTENALVVVRDIDDNSKKHKFDIYQSEYKEVQEIADYLQIRYNIEVTLSHGFKESYDGYNSIKLITSSNLVEYSANKESYYLEKAGLIRQEELKPQQQEEYLTNCTRPLVSVYYDRALQPGEILKQVYSNKEIKNNMIANMEDTGFRIMMKHKDAGRQLKEEFELDAKGREKAKIQEIINNNKNTIQNLGSATTQNTAIRIATSGYESKAPSETPNSSGAHNPSTQQTR